MSLQQLKHTEILSGEDQAVVRRSVLPGGVTVLSENMPGLRSASIGLWIGVGSRDEGPAQLGATHVLEHMLFKGTRKRSALQIAQAFDRTGGISNAATAKEFTCYYATVRGDDVPLAVDVLTDMVANSVIDPVELERERGVIVDELAMAADDPWDTVHEQFAVAMFGDHPLGRPIGGTPETLAAIGRDDVLAHYRRAYSPAGLVVTAAGGVDHDQLCEQISAGLRGAGWELSHDEHRRPLSAGRLPPVPSPAGGIHVPRENEQVSLLFGVPGLAEFHDDRFVLSVLSAILGGGMSSRLFQEVREKRGLAYGAETITGGFSDSGYFGIAAGCAPEQVNEVARVSLEQWQLMADVEVSGEELESAISQLTGGTVLALEDSASRMNRLGQAELNGRPFTRIDDVLEQLREVSAADVRRLAAELLARPRSISTVGPLTARQIEELETIVRM